MANWWESAPIVQQPQQKQPQNVANWWDSAPIVDQNTQDTQQTDKFRQGTEKALEQLHNQSPGFMDIVKSIPEATARVGSAALQGATFGFGDEALAGLSALPRAAIEGKGIGQAYDDTLQGVRNFDKESEKLSPTAYALGNIAGGLAVPGLGAGGTAAKGAEAAATASKGLFGALKAGLKGAAVAAPMGAAAGFGTGEGGLENRLAAAEEGGKWGALLGGGIPVVGKAVKGLAGALMPEVDEGVRAAAQLAQDYNIPLGVDQITNSKARQFLSSATGRVPFSGGGKLAEAQQKAFNREVLKTIGVEGADRVSDDVVDSAIKNIGQKFDDVLAGKTVTVQPEQLQKFQSIADDASLALSGDKQKAVQKAIEKVTSNIDTNGQITGEKINDVRSSLSKIAKSADPGIKQYLDDIIDHVVDISTDGDPAAKNLLNEARYQWKNLRTIEPLLAKATDGDISPANLRNRVTSKFGGLEFARGGAGQLGDLSRVGDLIKPKVGDTGTAERAIGYGALLGGPGMFMSGPVGALASVAGGIGASKAYQAYNRSQKLVNAILNRGGSKQITGSNAKQLAQLLSNPALLGRNSLALEQSQGQ